jgi:hypothetical protein
MFILIYTFLLPEEQADEDWESFKSNALWEIGELSRKLLSIFVFEGVNLHRKVQFFRY